MLSRKEIYERVSAHLLTQGVVSEDDNGSCRLRCEDGRKCAIGSLISDEIYCPNVEGIGISYYQHASDGALLEMLYASNVNVRISVMVISRFGERDQSGRWCCAVKIL